MESNGFAHCDLAARNVLVGEASVPRAEWDWYLASGYQMSNLVSLLPASTLQANLCKIADFGLTRRLRHRAYWTGPSTGLKVLLRRQSQSSGPQQ